MSTLNKVIPVAMVLSVGGWLVSPSWASDAGRSAAHILKELDDVPTPSFDAGKKKNRTYTRQFQTKLRRRRRSVPLNVDHGLTVDVEISGGGPRSYE